MSEELATIERDYPVLFAGGVELAEVLADNFGPDGMSAGDLERVRIPAGGGAAWEVPTLEGIEPIKAIEGIILSWTSPRSFWSESIEMTGGDTPPDCFSDDGEFGQGVYGPGSDDNPTGRCEDCPMNAWGSAALNGSSDSRGKACKEMRLLYVLRPGEVIPLAVQLPPTSIAPLRKYFLKLASAGLSYYSVVTKLELEQTTSGGYRYSVVKPSMTLKLSDDQRSAAKAYSASIRGVPTD